VGDHYIRRKQVGAEVPPGGVVRVIPVSDQEWARTLRFEGGTRIPPEPSPEQLTIFLLLGGWESPVSVDDSHPPGA